MAEPRQRPDVAERVRGAVARQLVRLPAPLQLLLSGRKRVTVDGQALDPALQLLLAVRPRHAGLLEAGPVASRARLQREVMSIRGRPTAIGRVTALTIPTAAAMLPARLYVSAKSSTPVPLLVYFHGGGFVLGGLETHDEPCRLIAAHAGHHVLSVDYRLAPEHPFPAAMEDALGAFQWAVGHAGQLGAGATQVCVGGDSAGANLAAIVCLRTRGLPVRPAAQLLIYPPTDAQTPRRSHQLFDREFMLTMADREAFYAQYLSGVPLDRGDPQISPLNAPDLSALPPALVVTAGFDILRDESEAYAAALVAANTPCELHREPSLTHGFVNLTGACPAAHRAVVALAVRWAATVAPGSTAE